MGGISPNYPVLFHEPHLMLEESCISMWIILSFANRYSAPVVLSTHSQNSWPIQIAFTRPRRYETARNRTTLDLLNIESSLDLWKLVYALYKNRISIALMKEYLSFEVTHREKILSHAGMHLIIYPYNISIGIPIINLRRSSDRLRFIMGIPIPVRRCLLSE